jgi:3-phenylpropionate/trans-cinnamate dioxygenase ferredoxin component
LAWHEVAEALSLGDEEALGVRVAEREIALCRSRGELYALDNICTHQFAVLSQGYVEDGCIECPLHQGRFSLATGAPLAPPVTEPVRVYRVRTQAGKVYVELPD